MNPEHNPEENDKLKLLAREKEISDKIINHSRSMISIINRDYVYEKVNSAFCNAHMVINDAIIGKTLSEVWGQDTFRDLIKGNIDLCFSGKTVKYEAAFDTPKAGRRYFEVTFRPISVENGKITHLLAETFDINDLKLSEQAALEKDAEFKKFEANLPLGFIRCDTEGNILHANNAFLDIMECANESGLNLNFRSLYPDEGFFELQLLSLLECQSKTFGRVSLRNSKGKEVPCRVSGFLGFNEAGAPAFIDFIVEDSSREMMLENRLIQAQKLETIGALAGGIAHDFNNILATISGYSEMLKEDLPESSPSSEKISKIQRAVLKAQSIINQILTFSRQVEQEKIPVNVSEVLKETIGFVRSALPPDIDLRYRILRRNANVLADPTQLFRVFLNLITNAIQSMEGNRGIISVKLNKVQGQFVKHELNKDIVADEYVLLTFEDTGKGMESSLLGRIFEPFFTTREVGKGTGLGLSVVHGVIMEMDGEILVSSKKGKGSVFYVYLPVSKTYAASSIKNMRKRILFIKGNKHESRIFSLALENSGYELFYVSDQKALDKVLSDLNKRPDLIIYMNDSKQIEPENLIGIFMRLKINTPCILITDPNQELFEEKILNSGIIKQHLIKPVSLKEISSAIELSLK